MIPVIGNSFCLMLIVSVAATALAAGFFCDTGEAAATEIEDHGANALNSTPDLGHNNPICKSTVADMEFRFEESSTVRGSGEVSIKGSFHDTGVDSSGWMKGSGSISLESLRNMSKIRQEVEFIQKDDLVFAGGQLKNRKSMSLPLFENGTGATVRERFNLSHVDRSETNAIRSFDRFNNSMIYDTALAFDGKWDLENRRGWSIYMNRSKQSYSGSFQTQKKIVFDDSDQG